MPDISQPNQANQRLLKSGRLGAKQVWTIVIILILVAFGLAVRFDQSLYHQIHKIFRGASLSTVARPTNYSFTYSKLSSITLTGNGSGSGVVFEHPDELQVFGQHT